MSEVVRFGVAMEAQLLGDFDRLLEQRGYENRSEALRDLVRRELDQDAWNTGKAVVATITLVYDHHVRELSERLTEIQHDHGDCIVSALHVHLDHDHCLEVIAARGAAQEVKSLADRLIQTKGVLSGHVAPASLPAVKGDAHTHSHSHWHAAGAAHSHSHAASLPRVRLGRAPRKKRA